MNRTVIQGHLAAFTANAIFGISIVMTKPLLSDWMSPLGYNILRMMFGSAAFWVTGLFYKKEKIPFKDLLLILAGGFVGTTLPNLAFAFGLNYTTPAIWSIVMATSPVVVLLLSGIFFKEAIVPKKAAGILLGITGAIVIATGSSQDSRATNNTIGIIIAVLTVISYSSSMLIMRKNSAKYSPVVQMKWMLLLSVVLVGPFSISELPRQRIFSGEVTLIPLLLLGFCFIFATFIAFLLGPVALKRINASSASIYMSVQPLTACIVSIVIGQDIFSWDKLTAFILVAAGLFLITHTSKE